MTSKINQTTDFRYDINALRAIAVLSVLLFHYKVPYFAGGFSGVDIFFVISGYLMSRIIINAINKKDFSILEFYKKRLQRIVPALLFLILILTVSCFFFYFPEDYKINEKNAAGSILFLSNILYWQNSNYFDPAAETNILVHTWSLSVEWQFYLIYPLILIGLSKFITRKIQWLWLFGIAIILIFIGSNIITTSHSTASFYLLPTRSWELLIGGFAFFSEDFIAESKKKALAFIGYIIIFLGIFFLHNLMPWPGNYTLIPVLATFLVIVSNVNQLEIIKHRTIQFLGKISYSLYLWHWPVYVIAQYAGIEFNFTSIIALTFVSFVFAYLSYSFIESLKLSSNLIVAGMVVLAMGTSALSYTDSNYILFKTQTLNLVNYAKNHDKEIINQMSYGCCFISTEHKGLVDFNKSQCLTIDHHKKNLLLIGDSHAAALSASLKEKLKDQNINLIQATSSGCFPIIRNNGKNRCMELMNFIYNDFIVKNANKIDGVIICGNWVGFEAKNQTDLVADMKNTLNYLKKFNLKAIVIGQNETYTIPYSAIAAKENEYNFKVSNKYLVQESYKVNQVLREKLNPYYVDIINFNSFPELSSTNDPYMFDANHFTKYGADLTTEKILTDQRFKNLINTYVAKL